MSYQADIYNAILAAAPVTAIIGDRFSWDIADGAVATPYLVAQTISVDGQADFTGGREWAFPLVQLTAWAPGKADCIAVIEAVRGALEGREIPGTGSTSASFAGSQSTYDRETRLFGEILELRLSTCITTN